MFVILAALLTIAILGLSKLGSFLVVEDPLEKADAIFVLGGTRFERPLEAVDLYKEGWAPRILLMRIVRDYGEVELMQRGFKFPLESDVQFEALTRMGIDPASITILGEKDNTRDEAADIRVKAIEHHWSRVIVVTSKQHTRRARLVIARQLAGTGTKVIMRASRYDRTRPDQWWRDRPTIRFTLFESQRLLGYWLGIAD